MKHIKLFEQFVAEAEYTPKAAQDQMLDILAGMGKRTAPNGKFKLLFDARTPDMVDSYSKMSGLTPYDDKNILVATSNDKKELMDMKKEFWSSIFPEHKRALKYYGFDLTIK